MASPDAEVEGAVMKEEEQEDIAAAPIGSTKRERKPVQRLEIADSRTKTKAKIDAEAGKGVKLGSIPNISYKLSKLTGADDVCKIIHNLLYRRSGKVRFSSFCWKTLIGEVTCITCLIYIFSFTGRYISDINVLYCIAIHTHTHTESNDQEEYIGFLWFCIH